VNDLFTIGEFSRSTHLSVKALRHYHDLGLLEPTAVDPATGYRAYSVAQVPAAQVIRRLRDLDMPLDEVRAVLHASEAGDVDARDRLIVDHLQRMEAQLEQTQASVASLRALLEGSQPGIAVAHRAVPALRVLAITDPVAWDDAEAWLAAAFDALHARAPEVARLGPDSALYPSEFFEAHLGEVVACVAVDGTVEGDDRARIVELPAATLAVAVHEGPFAELDRSYAALGAYVAGRAIGTDGPIRERYLVATADDPTDLRTEVGWPVTAAG
jgi:DNA-binding transcriptional MerR regulator/effector-binding domain-containing protein